MGLLQDLLGITAGCAYVETTSAVFIGIISERFYYFSNHFIERALKVDDVVGAVAVHAACGAWGAIGVGLFITGDRLGNISRYAQITAQLTGIIVCLNWAFGYDYRWHVYRT